MDAHGYLTFLFTEELTALGIDPKWRFGMADRVRFSEIDALRHANHTASLRWFESLRMHYLSQYEISTYDATCPEVVLRGLEATYHAPLFAGEDYIALTRTASFRRTSFRMEFAVHAPDLRVTGSAIVVLLDPETGAKTPLTEANKAMFLNRDGAMEET